MNSGNVQSHSFLLISKSRDQHCLFVVVKLIRNFFLLQSLKQSFFSYVLNLKSSNCTFFDFFINIEAFCKKIGRKYFQKNAFQRAFLLNSAKILYHTKQPQNCHKLLFWQFEFLNFKRGIFHFFNLCSLHKRTHLQYFSCCVIITPQQQKAAI